jgi:hypothetical protein
MILHRALLLQQVQLKQFQTNTAELMEKVNNLENIIHDTKKQPTALSNTSKFGAGLQVPGHGLEDSRGLPQNSLKSGSTFTDLIMNSSKLEPTDTS